MVSDASVYRDLAERSWRWVLRQVRWTDGPWIPQSVDVDGDGEGSTTDDYRDGLHDGIGGLALALAEVRATRPWTAEEGDLATALADRLAAQIATVTDVSFFDGLSGRVATLLALDAPGEKGADAAIRRMLDISTSDGWPALPAHVTSYRPGARVNDATLGTASVLLAAVWAMRHDVDRAAELADLAADVLLAEGEPGPDWTMVPPRFEQKPQAHMPNWSHGLSGIAGSLALAGAELGRADLVETARLGAEHLVSLGDTADSGFVVPLSIPPADPAKANPVSYGWCHGPIGTSRLFLALDRAGVSEVAGRPTTSWYARGLHSVRVSGVPDRLWPGFWDNDGRCCGTAGVGDGFLDSFVRTGDADDLAFAVRLGDALVERAVVSDDHAYWRFLEHRAEEPLLPPGVGWMQGAAGISAYLFRLSRVVDQGRDAPIAPRLESWWVTT
ncbi:MAG TPA: lanthionine synthetase LanC family protein [Lapillicoccus sp.]|nr:lanthionine synthetase LanC family protein [Lapillicoccus sp.]